MCYLDSPFKTEELILLPSENVLMTDLSQMELPLLGMSWYSMTGP